MVACSRLYTGRMVAKRTDTYGAIHRRLGRERGPARDYPCVDCGRAAEAWSYARPDPVDERADRRGCPYSLDLSRYDPRCRSCHVRLDGHGRFASGLANPVGKLSDADKATIRQARIGGDSLYVIARRFGISPSRVYQLCKGIPSPNPPVA